LLDWKAASICIRINSILAACNHKINVIPRHAGYDKELIFKRLAKTKTLFIIATKKKFDKTLLKEIEFYYKNRRKAKIVQFSPMIPGWSRPKELNARFYPVRKKSNYNLSGWMCELHKRMTSDDEESRLVETLIISMLMVEYYSEKPQK